MTGMYGAWGVYIASVAAQLLYWQHVGPAADRARALLQGDLWAPKVRPLAALAVLSLAAWPFVTASHLYGYESPSLFRLLLTWGAATFAGWVMAVLAHGIAENIRPDLGVLDSADYFRRLSTLLAWLAIGLPGAAYFAAFTAH